MFNEISQDRFQMHSPLFVSLSDSKIAKCIEKATQRVALVAPGIGSETAAAILNARSRLGAEKVYVIVDCDEEVVRLGYGCLKALRKITDAGQIVGQSSGLRIGVLVCDEIAYSFAPTALYVEPEVHSNETPNAIVLKCDDVDRILARIIPKELRESVVPPDKEPPLSRALKDLLNGMLPNAESLDKELSRLCFKAVDAMFRVHSLESPNEVFELSTLLNHLSDQLGSADVVRMAPYIEYAWERLYEQEGAIIEQADFDAAFDAITPKKPKSSQIASELAVAEVEVGSVAVSAEIIRRTEQCLELAPPIPFDVARQVRVFEPYVQYVEVNLKGCHIERRTVELPKSIQGLDPNADLSARLHTKFDLIEKSSTVSSKEMESEVKKLRDLTKPLGKPWGRVILRNSRERFDKRVEELRKKLEDHKETVETELEGVLSDSRARLIEHFFPLVKQNPPDELLSQIVNSPPTDDQIRQWLDTELDKTFPSTGELMSDMSLDVQYRDVTYETLNQEGFGEKLRQAYPMVDWDKPFEEFDAARERDAKKAQDEVSSEND